MLFCSASLAGVLTASIKQQAEGVQAKQQSFVFLFFISIAFRLL
jgi:hypothetical protein